MQPGVLVNGTIGTPTTVLDTFTDVNGALIAAHTPDVGGPWTLVFGSFTIQANQAESAASSLATVPAPVGDLDIVAVGSVSNVANGSWGVAFRVLDNDDYWRVQLSMAPPTRLELSELIAGGSNVRASVPVPQDLLAHEIRVHLRGDRCDVYLDGALKLTHFPMGTGAATNKAGIRVAPFGGGLARVDYFEVIDR